ncbi:MAG: TRAP transporter small permease [Clostridiales bacterium]|nr:TRAP transporter small permease [Clostridiales bacterium]
MNFIRKIDQAIEHVFSVVMSASNIVICAMILIGAFMRYILKKDFYGMEELVLLIAFWMYFMGSAMASREGSQVSADLIASLLKSVKQRSVMAVIRIAITVALFALLGKWALDYVLWDIDMNPKTAVYKLPMLIAHIPIFMSFVLSTLYEIRNLWKACLDVRKAFGKGEEGKQWNS